MENDPLAGIARTHLAKLCQELPHRSTGSQYNRQATDYFAAVTRSLGWETRTPRFDCLDWKHGDARLAVQGEEITAYPCIYTLGCDLRLPLVTAASLDELGALDMAGKIVLLGGALAGSQLTPRNYPFYQVEEHQAIYRLLENGKPEAVIAATGRDLQMVGDFYPFSLFEDGDFDIPAAYIKDVDGERLALFAGQPVELSVQAERSPAEGCNVNAIKGAHDRRRLVVCAHIDSRLTTPGANDNASGAVTLLLLAELLQDYAGELGIELVAINGEDHYSAAGEVLYLQENQGRMDEIALAVNLDDVGYIEGRNAYSFYGCPQELMAAARQALSSNPDLAEGEPWYQSDHMVFAMNGVAAMAVTSDRFAEMMQTITHTTLDTIDLVDPRRLASLARALRDLLSELSSIE